MRSRPVNLAVVGCGDVANQRHLPAIARHDMAKLVAVCDVSRERVDAATRRFAPDWGTTDVADIFNDVTIDGVIIATPPWITPRLTVAGLQAGKDVLCEKPMALTIDEARSVQDAERATDRLVQVGFVLRHGPLFGALRRWIADDWLGRPLDIRISVFDERWNPDGNPEHYQRILSTLEHGAPCIHDGAHTMDHLHFLLGDRAVRLSSWGTTSRPEFPRPNYNLAVIEFERGDRARVEIGWFLPEFPPGEWSIIGPNGAASFCQRDATVELHCTDGTERVAIEKDWIESCFRHQLDTFVQAIQDRVPPTPGSADGIASLALCQQVESGMATPFTPIEVHYP